MADKRMFSKKITDSDAFTELSSSAQALYFHLNQGADDDGFNNQIQFAMYKSHASVDDLNVLLLKHFIIRFENGVIAIKHWRIHNTLRKDRYTPTNFQEEFKLLTVKENGAYTIGCQVVAERLPNGCQTVAERLPQYSIDKNSIDKNSIVEVDTCAHTREETTATTVCLPISNTNTIQLDNKFLEQLGKLYPNINISDELKRIELKLVASGYPCKSLAGLQKYIIAWFRRKAEDNIELEKAKGIITKDTDLNKYIKKYSEDEV